MRRVFFDILAVFGERRRADHLDLAAGKRRLQDVRGVHAALRVAGADKVVHLVDEQDDVAVLLHLVDKALDAAFKLAAELRARHKRRQVQKLHFLLAQLRRHLAGRDAQRKALGDCRLADARLADQARVVLRAAREDLHHALDLALAPDDIVELAAARLHRQVGAVRRSRRQLGVILCSQGRIAGLPLPAGLEQLGVAPGIGAGGAGAAVYDQKLHHRATSSPTAASSSPSATKRTRWLRKDMLWALRSTSRVNRARSSARSAP